MSQYGSAPSSLRPPPATAPAWLPHLPVGGDGGQVVRENALAEGNQVGSALHGIQELLEAGVSAGATGTGRSARGCMMRRARCEGAQQPDAENIKGVLYKRELRGKPRIHATLATNECTCSVARRPGTQPRTPFREFICHILTAGATSSGRAIEGRGCPDGDESAAEGSASGLRVGKSVRSRH